jgi:hypothetical protein
MKNLLLVIAILFFGTAFSQEEKLFQVSPHWKVGDKRKVHTDFSTKVIYDGVLISDQRNVYDVNFLVLSTDDQFILSYSSSDRLPTVLSNPDDERENASSLKIRSLLRNAEDQICKSDLQVRVNKQTCVASDIKNGLEILKNVEHKTRKELLEWAMNEKISEKDIRNMEIDLSKRFAEMYPKIQQTILDKTSLIFSSYNVSFPMNEAIEKKVMTRDLTASSKSDTLFPAIITMESVEVNDKMVIKTSLDYDKEFLLAQLKKSYHKLDNVKASEVSILEKEEIIFDLNTTWIQHHIMNLHFEIPGMKTITKSSVTFL